MESLLKAIGSTANSIRSLVSNVGGAALGGLSNINPDLGGKAGKAVDTIGKALGNPFPETYASERAESGGGYSQRTAIEQNPNLTPQQKTERINQLNYQTQQRTGQQPATGGNGSLAGREMTANEVAARAGLSSEHEAWNGKEVVIDGQRYRVKDTGRGTRVLEAVSAPSAPSVDVGAAVSKAGGADLLSQYIPNLNDLLGDWAANARGSTDELAAEIERVARENAEREYQDILRALGVKKQEVQTIAGQQREALGQEREFGLEELSGKEETERKAIEKQKAGFEQELSDTTDQLARNWRDMSLEVQRIMRGRGITDSSYAAGKETDILLDFNKGLRKIAQQSTAALKDFADGIEETVKYYTRQKAQLDFNFQQAMQGIDNWVRQQIQSIQAQEDVALSSKLAQINEAVLQARQLRVNTEQKIADQQLAYGMWLEQIQMQYKLAVATAAQEKVESGVQNINKVRDLFKLTSDILDNGGAIIPKRDDSGNLIGASVYGIVPGTNEEIEVPITLQGAQNILNQIASEQRGGNINAFQLAGLQPTDQQSRNQTYTQFGFPELSTPTQPTQQRSGGGILDAIGSLFGF